MSVFGYLEKCHRRGRGGKVGADSYHPLGFGSDQYSIKASSVNRRDSSSSISFKVWAKLPRSSTILIVGCRTGDGGVGGVVGIVG